MPCLRPPSCLVRALALAVIVLGACASGAPNPDAADQRAPAPVALTRVAFHVLPEDGSAWLTDLLDHARQRVRMTMYLASDEHMLTSVGAAAGRGVDVRAMIEGDVPANSTAANARAVDALRQSGAQTRKPNPAFRLTHQKSFVIDDALVITTANLTRSAWTANREFAVVVESPGAVDEAVRAFDADWARSPFVPRHPALVWSPNNARARWLWLVAQAHTSLDVYAETAADHATAQVFGEAVRRGVAVRLLISPGASPADGNGPGLDELQRVGVRVRLLRIPYVHAKTISADRQLAYIGSTNISSTSLDYNRELGVLVADPVALARLTATYDRDWARAVDR